MKIVLSIALLVFLSACGDEKEAKHTEIKKSAQSVKSEVVKEPVAVKKEVKEVVAAPLSGEELFMKCASCHGAHAEKKALNTSNIIKGWDSSKIEKALHGYKDGSYGGNMKGIMKSQVSKLTDKQIKILAEYISKL